MELDLCRNASASGLDLTFVATGGGDLEEDFRASGVEFIRLNRKLPVDLKLASQLRRIIKERNINVVHGHQPVDALHSYLATRGSGVKRVLTLHGLYAGAKNDLALRFVLPRMDARVSVSNDVLRLAGEQGFDTRKDFFVVNNGVDPRRLLSTRKTLRTELGLGADTALLGMIANFYPDGRKDQLTVCKALPQLFASAPEARFVFVGSAAEDVRHLFDQCVTFCQENRISDRVHFLGKRFDIPDVLSSLDVFVLSSLREGSPISVIEAMMVGVPAVLSDIPALREISNDGERAALFRTGDADDLAAKLIALLNDSGERQSFASGARQWALEQFGIDRHIANLTRLYSSLVK